MEQYHNLLKLIFYDRSNDHKVVKMQQLHGQAVYTN